VKLRRRLLALSLAGAVAAGCGGSGGPGASVLLNQGTAAFTRNDYTTAARLFQQAIKKAPSNPTAYYDLGAVYQAQHDKPDALTQYRRALSRDPTMVSAIFNEAIIESDTDVTLAEFLYRKAIQIQPDSPTAYFNLGLLYAQQGLKAQAGIALRKAVQLDPALRREIPTSAVADLTAPPPKSNS
jgi:tetratricopeptide (TPR) repeat protein